MEALGEKIIYWWKPSRDSEFIGNESDLLRFDMGSVAKGAEALLVDVTPSCNVTGMLMVIFPGARFDECKSRHPPRWKNP